MSEQWGRLNPVISIVMWRVIGLLLLTLLWLNDLSKEVGVILLLFLLIMAVARWRFSLPGWTILLDQLACFVTVPFWPQAVYGLAIPLFEGVLIGKPWVFIPGLIGTLYLQPTLPLIVVLIQAGLSGWFIRGWSLETNMYRQEADTQRRDRYELENLKAELLMANVRVARMAELTERNRIAQELHDNVGHELTGAVLAIKAFEQLWKEKDPLAVDMFSQAKERLNKSALYLRQTAHNIKPMVPTGISRFEEICKSFKACPLEQKIFGDTTKVPVHLWSVLEPCLKEGLTNVIRHAKAKKVDVTLDINPHIVRLCIRNDGETNATSRTGMGLRNLRQRARAVGGNISTDNTNGFRLVCVLPIDG